MGDEGGAGSDVDRISSLVDEICHSFRSIKVNAVVPPIDLLLKTV